MLRSTKVPPPRTTAAASSHARRKAGCNSAAAVGAAARRAAMEKSHDTTRRFPRGKRVSERVGAPAPQPPRGRRRRLSAVRPSHPAHRACLRVPGRAGSSTPLLQLQRRSVAAEGEAGGGTSRSAGSTDAAEQRRCCGRRGLSSAAAGACAVNLHQRYRARTTPPAAPAFMRAQAEVGTCVARRPHWPPRYARCRPPPLAWSLCLRLARRKCASSRPHGAHPFPHVPSRTS